jgi:hypothetical protein
VWLHVEGRFAAGDVDRLLDALDPILATRGRIDIAREFDLLRLRVLALPLDESLLRERIRTFASNSEIVAIYLRAAPSP